MSVTQLDARVDAAAGADTAAGVAAGAVGTTGTADPLHSGLPVVWHVVVDVPFDVDGGRDGDEGRAVSGFGGALSRIGRVSTRRTGLTLESAASRLHSQADRLRVAERVLALLGEFDGVGEADGVSKAGGADGVGANGAGSNGASGWQVTVSARGVRAERDGGSFEQLEQRLRDEGLTADDVTVGVEYARSWGML